MNYPAPKGSAVGTAEYTVKKEKPALYNGVEPNQLLKDGEEYKGADPYLEEMFTLEEKAPDISYRKLAEDPLNGLDNAKEYIL